MKKKVITIVLAMVMCIGLTSIALASEVQSGTSGGSVRIRTDFRIDDEEFEWNGETVGDLWFGVHDLGMRDEMPSQLRIEGDPASGGRLTGVQVRHALPLTQPADENEPWGVRRVAVSISTFSLDGAGATEGKAGFILDLNKYEPASSAEPVAAYNMEERHLSLAGNDLITGGLRANSGTRTILNNIDQNVNIQAVWTGRIHGNYTPAPTIGNYQATITWWEIIAN